MALGNVDGSLGVRGAQAEQEAAISILNFHNLGPGGPAGMTLGGFETAASHCESACTTTALWHAPNIRSLCSGRGFVDVDGFKFSFRF